MKAEVAFAAQLPKFSPVRAALTQILQQDDAATVRQTLASLKGTPFQKAFFDAMVFDLDY